MISMLRRPLSLAAIAFVLSSAAAYAGPHDDAKAHVAFGVAVAQMGLWREAIYRWERAIEIDPTYAAAYNNLGVAYEQEGLFDKARAAYEKALAIDPKNTHIRWNYDLFRDIHDRTNPRDVR